MKPLYLLALLALPAVAPAGASLATPFRAPAEFAHVRLERADSGNVLVDKIWLERKAGPLCVCGTVLQRLRGGDTDGTILEVALLDARGAVLRRFDAGFTPRHLERRLGRPAAGAYRIEMGDLPAGTVAVRVQARDGAG